MGMRPLSRARKNRNDGFHTQLSDMENGPRHYRTHFRDRVVHCNCDDPGIGNFFHYFSHSFQRLGLRKLTATCYRSQERDLFSRNDPDRALMLEYDGFRIGERVPNAGDIGLTPLKGDGDFRSRECAEILKRVTVR